MGIEDMGFDLAGFVTALADQGMVLFGTAWQHRIAKCRVMAGEF